MGDILESLGKLILAALVFIILLPFFCLWSLFLQPDKGDEIGVKFKNIIVAIKEW